MKKSIIIISVAAVFSIAFAFYQYIKPTSKVVEGVPAYSVSATELFTTFETNETEGNRKYLNQVIQVSGEIADITATDSLGMSISLDAGNGLFGVTCEIADATNVNKLQRGQLISVKGLCTGKLMDVVLVKCIIQPINIVTP